MTRLHSLLRRQLQRHFGGIDSIPEGLHEFVDVVDAAYREFDVDRSMLERSLELSSNELLQANADLRATFAALPDLFFRVDAQGTILDYKAGPGSEPFLTESGILGKNLSNVVPGSIGAGISDCLDLVISNQLRRDIEYTLPSGNSSNYYEARFLPLPGRQAIVLFRDITARKRAEISIHQSDARIRRQNQVLVDLARSNVLGDANWEEALAYLTEAGSHGLQVARVGIWLYAENDQQLRCLDLYESGSNSHTRYQTMATRDYPGYFAALERDHIVAAEDAVSDPRTRELADSYLVPNGIGSMLDLPIRSMGKIIGVVCHEHIGDAREWTPEEQAFARSMADLVSLSFETHERGRMKSALDESEAKFRIFAETTESSIIVVRQKILYANPATERLTGYGLDELTGMTLMELIPPEFSEWADSYMQKCLTSEETSARFETKIRTRSGVQKWIFVTIGVIRFEGHPTLLISGFDITDRKAMEQQLRHETLHDSLTGLPNRTLFLDRLNHSMEIFRRRSGSQFAVLFLDLDRFKLVNDSFGHAIGDGLLTEVARRLQECLRPGDTVARLGGDEFTLLLEDVSGLDQACDISARIRARLEQPMQIEGYKVFASASIGIVLSDSHYLQSEDMVRDADIAMYRAKSGSATKIEVFDSRMRTHVRKLLTLETDLRQALSREEFRLHYQPVVDLASGSIVAFEALLRWYHPERGLVSPVEFIAMAEDTGLILPMGEWVIREACRQVKRCQAEYQQTPVSINVNVSARQFEQPDFVEMVSDLLHQESVDCSRLGFELTETTLMQNPAFSVRVMEELKSLGIQLHIDDFGTGYSSLGYLHHYNIDTLKIDRSFISGIRDNSEGTEIIRAVIALASGLGLKVVAEGIESQYQWEVLRHLHCGAGQGYFFSRPVAAEEMIALTSGRPPWMSSVRVAQ